MGCRSRWLSCLNNELQASQSYGETLSQTPPPSTTTNKRNKMAVLYVLKLHHKKDKGGNTHQFPNTQLEIVCRHFSQVIDDIPAINSISLF